MLKFLYSRPLPKDIAKDRLKFIIVNDREGITPYMLDVIKNEILTTIVKYINVDVNSVSVKLSKNSDIDDENSLSLVAVIPFCNNFNK